MDLSIIVPFFNEEESIKPLYNAIRTVVDGLGIDYEMIFVDDGSHDKTFEISSKLARKDKRLKVVRFSRNYGQTPAMAAGIDLAVGDVIVTMDGDLQNDPSDIPLFLEKIAEGHDIVVGWRYHRQDKLISRRIPSKIANWLIGKVTGVPIKDNGCSLKAYRRDVIQQIPLYSEMHRFIPAMTSLSGARIVEIKVKHHARQFGESKYGLSRIYKVLMDLMTIKAIIAFGAKPMYWFAILSVITAIPGIICLAYILARMLGGNAIPISIAGSGVLFIALSFMLIMIGALCELIYRTGDVDLTRMAQITAGTVGTDETSDQDIYTL